MVDLFQKLNGIVALPVFETIAIRVKQLRIGSTFFLLESFVFFDIFNYFTVRAHFTRPRYGVFDVTSATSGQLSSDPSEFPQSVESEQAG